MEYFTELIGKQIVSIYEKEVVGTLLNIDFDWARRQVKNLVILGADEETIFLLNPRSVFGIGECITIRNCASLNISVEQNFPRLIGQNAIGLSGKSFGKLNEIGIENWNLQILYTAETIEPTKIFCITNNFLMINDLGKRLSLSNFRPRQIAIPQDSHQTVSILDAESSIALPKTITAQSNKNK